jgi:murein DD-endopeptidase MepM/ murein hydrolase activator NlpD
MGGVADPFHQNAGKGNRAERMALQLRSPVTEPFHEFGWPRPSTGTAANDFRITSPFGWRDDPLNPGRRVFHNALDIGNGRLGYPVVAVAPGIVVAAGWLLEPWSVASPADKRATWGPNYGGIMVVIRHEGGVISLNAHLGTRTVNAGDRVTSGQRIGTVGETGSAYHRGHLHFALRKSLTWIDPEPFVRLGRPLDIEDDEMTFLPAEGVAGIQNRDCEIRSGTNYRSAPTLDAATILGTTPTDKQIGFRPIFRYDKGADVNGSRVWYWGPLWVDGKGYGFVFVHGSRITPLTISEKVSDATLTRRIRDKNTALAEIEAEAKRGQAI